MVGVAIKTATRFYPPELLSRDSKLVFFSTSTGSRCLLLLEKCSSMKHLYQLQAQTQTTGLHKVYPSVTAETVKFCSLNPSGSLSYARHVLEHSNDSSLSSWNDFIRGHVSRNSPIEAISAFLAMRSKGIKPNYYTYPFLFKACVAFSGSGEGVQVHSDAVKNGYDSVVFVANTLIQFYASCGNIKDACQVFEEMSFRTVVSWNSVISACVENSNFDECTELLVRMRDNGFEPDETTMVALLSASAELGSLNMGKWIHSQVIGKGLTLNCELGTSLVNMYAKCGDLSTANQVFDMMITRNVWTWTAMILGLAQHGSAIQALEVFKTMKACGVQPNYVTFLGVLCACSHAGLVDDACHLFHVMQHKYNIKPVMAHYGSMVDCFGRAGCLHEAYDFILNMTDRPDAVIWRSLLSACNIHDINDYSKVAESVREKLLELEPQRSGNFVMVAHRYAAAGMWKKVENLRGGMRGRGLTKMAGVSCIQVGGPIHKFFNGYDSNSFHESIHLFLDSINLHMNMIDYK